MLERMVHTDEPETSLQAVGEQLLSESHTPNVPVPPFIGEHSRH